ncbi:MAG: aspartate aminotransferase family protein [Myxococcota bacterium]
MSAHRPLRGDELPELVAPVPGPSSSSLVDALARSECPAITARRARRAAETGVPQDPIVWAQAKGANVRDVDGNRYVDLTSAFAVAGLGHAHPDVVAAGHAQLDRLVHAMGDVYPSDVKIAFTETLAHITPDGLEQSILGLSGASAIEAALKTAAIHTGKPGVLAFWGGYHGLSHGALGATAYRREFRQPFLGQLNPYTHHVPYPDPYRPPFGLPPDTAPGEVVRMCLAHVRAMLEGPATAGEGIGAMVVEPMQGRGGVVLPPAGFLRGLREICDEHGVVLIFDEIYTGFARTGRMFACDHEGVVPDVLCVGKAMGGGFPISAAVGRPAVMQSWGASKGESVHTSTFLGNPLGCAMAKAALDVLMREDWAARARAAGAELHAELEELAVDFPQVVGEVRSRGMMLGVDLVTDPETRAPHGALAIALTGALRARGYLVLPSGTAGNVLTLTPPFVLSVPQREGFLRALRASMRELLRHFSS